MRRASGKAVAAVAAAVAVAAAHGARASPRPRKSSPGNLRLPLRRKRPAESRQPNRAAVAAVGAESPRPRD